MKVLKRCEVDRCVRMKGESSGKRPLRKWVFSGFYFIEEYIEESKKCFPDGLTYDEAFEYLEGK